MGTRFSYGDKLRSKLRMILNLVPIKRTMKATLTGAISPISYTVHISAYVRSYRESRSQLLGAVKMYHVSLLCLFTVNQVYTVNTHLNCSAYPTHGMGWRRKLRKYPRPEEVFAHCAASTARTVSLLRGRNHRDNLFLRCFQAGFVSIQEKVRRPPARDSTNGRSGSSSVLTYNYDRPHVQKIAFRTAQPLVLVESMLCVAKISRSMIPLEKSSSHVPQHIPPGSRLDPPVKLYSCIRRNIMRYRKYSV